MPTFLRLLNWRFHFYSDEGMEPPHIHVDTGEGECKYWLEPIRLAIHSDINLLRDSGAGSGGARAPHILMCMLRALCSGLPRPKAARYDF